MSRMLVGGPYLVRWYAILTRTYRGLCDLSCSRALLACELGEVTLPCF